jgi:hypothetical protein
MDLGRTPTRILLRHPLKQVADFLADLRSSGASARTPVPITAERGPVPGDYDVHDDEVGPAASLKLLPGRSANQRS